MLPEHPAIGIALLHATPSEIETIALGEWFTPEDLKEFERISSRRRRVEWLAVRIALKKTIVADKLAESPLHAHIRKTPKGAPYLVLYNPDTGHYAQLSCSLSHKGALTLAAYSRVIGMRVGIDIERRSWILHHVKRRFICEADAMTEKNDATGDFTILWAFKEATTKLLGIGSAYGFTKVQCHETGAGVCELRDAGGNHYAGQYSWFGKYAIALVTSPPATCPALPPKRRKPLFERLRRAKKLRRLRKERVIRDALRLAEIAPPAELAPQPSLQPPTDTATKAETLAAK